MKIHRTLYTQLYKRTQHNDYELCNTNALKSKSSITNRSFYDDKMDASDFGYRWLLLPLYHQYLLMEKFNYIFQSE